MLPPSIPLFPLPNVVLFPNVFLPLHIFEPRYRQMVADALAGDRLIGITLLLPGYGADYEGRPSIYGIGCAGVITHSQPLADGRYDIVLRGIEKFRVRSEDQSKPYRIGNIAAIDESIPPDETQPLRHQRHRTRAVGAEISAVSARRGSRQRARAVSRARCRRTPGAARMSRRPRALPGAHRRAGNEAARAERRMD